MDPRFRRRERPEDHRPPVRSAEFEAVVRVHRARRRDFVEVEVGSGQRESGSAVRTRLQADRAQLCSGSDESESAVRFG